MPRRSDGSEKEQQRLAAFGRRLRQLRSWRDLSQDALAQRSGLSRDFIAKVEQGRTSPGLLRMWELADGLEISIAELFGDDLPRSWDRRRQPTQTPS